MTDGIDGYAAFGEDLWIYAHYTWDSPGTMVDVGAGESHRASNSLFFEERGWWCLCLDPEPRHSSDLAKTRVNFEELAISETAGTTTLWQHRTKPTHSTLLPQSSESYTPRMVRTTTLDEIVSRYNLSQIDILDIDVEGHEIAVWRSLDKRIIMPYLVIVEYADSRTGCEYQTVVDHFKIDGYKPIHQTPANLIFERHYSSTSDRIRKRGS